ncbi:MAG TPA: tetratricopeptide repeat protein, partial [Chthonomonadaceae bacterium]|nr:tetratricopeptide repeat protein [Chthonomonadaceae bacterium]
PLCFTRTSPSAGRLLIALLLGMLAFAPRAARADFKLTLDNKDGDTISDIAKIVAHADSSDGIDKVEFYVDDQLRYTTQSVPYAYKWDTIPDTEGKHTLMVTAYDSNQQTKKTMLSLVIDNELALGAPALAQKAQAALRAGNNDTATRYCRRTLKADPGNLEASRVLAAIAASTGDWDRAVAVMEKAKDLDQNAPALLEMAGYRMHHALMPENALTFIPEYQKIVELRQKAADMVVDAVKKPYAAPGVVVPAAGHDAIGDAMLAAGRVHDALIEYKKAGDAAPLPSLNRYTLALVLDDQMQEAIAVTRPLIRDRKGDAATRAATGLAYLRQRQFDQARAIVQPDLTGSTPASYIVAAYADIALDHLKEALDEAKKAVELAPTAGDAHYAYSMAIRNLADSEQELIHAMSLSPFENGPLLDYAARIALQRKTDRYDDALKLTEIALERSKGDINAKLIQALLYLQKSRFKEAEPILDALVRMTPTPPDVHMAVAVYYDLKQSPTQARAHYDAAGKLDPVRFTPIIVPSPMELLQSYARRWHYRGDFYLTPTTLYPPKMEAAAQTP